VALPIPDSTPHPDHVDDTPQEKGVNEANRTERAIERLEGPDGDGDSAPVVLEVPVQDAETKNESPIDAGTATLELDSSLIVESPVQEFDSSRQEIPLGNTPKVTTNDTHVVFPLAVRTDVPKSPRDVGMVLAGQSPVEFSPDSPPQTPSSINSKRVRTPSTPRKRIASEIRENQDTSIMSELQASVRSREKRRLEKEKIEAAEKKKEELELRQSTLATMGRDITELGAWKTGDSVADPESVVKEVRTWRKQREASLKGQVDEAATAKARAIRETLSDEKIMADLMAAVQSRTALRSAPGACFVDPREKRQTMMLEELFARRVAVGQV